MFIVEPLLSQARREPARRLELQEAHLARAARQPAALRPVWPALRPVRPARRSSGDWSGA
jgi:hypothetical protein